MKPALYTTRSPVTRFEYRHQDARFPPVQKAQPLLTYLVLKVDATPDLRSAMQVILEEKICSVASYWSSSLVFCLVLNGCEGGGGA